MAEVDSYAMTLPEIAKKDGLIDKLQQDVKSTSKTLEFIGQGAAKLTADAGLGRRVREWARSINASL